MPEDREWYRALADTCPSCFSVIMRDDYCELPEKCPGCQAKVEAGSGILVWIPPHVEPAEKVSPQEDKL